MRWTKRDTQPVNQEALALAQARAHAHVEQAVIEQARARFEAERAAEETAKQRVATDAQAEAAAQGRAIADKEAISQPSLRKPSLSMVGTVLVVIVAFIGYSAYRYYSLVSLPPSSVANTEAQGRGGPVQPASTPGPATTPTVPVTATPTSAISPTGEVLAPPTPPAALEMTQQRAIREPVEPPAAAVAVPVAPPQPTHGDKAGERELRRLGPCTERIAALGLCTPKPEPTIEREPTSAGPAAVVRSRTNNGGKPCTEALAALGLCTSKSK